MEFVIALTIVKFVSDFIIIGYSEVPNRRADRNKRAGLEKSAALSFITRKIASRVERKSEKHK